MNENVKRAESELILARYAHECEVKRIVRRHDGAVLVNGKPFAAPTKRGVKVDTGERILFEDIYDVTPTYS